MVRSKLSSSNILSEEIPDGECLVYSCEKHNGDIIYRVNCLRKNIGNELVKDDRKTKEVGRKTTTA